MAAKNGRKYLKDEDFDEGDVWGVMDDNSSPKLRKPFKISSLYHHASSSSSSSSLTNAMAAPRMIPRSSSSSTSTSTSASTSTSVVSSEKQSSAPVEIPDWSKIYGNPIRKKKNGTIFTSWVDYNGVSHDGYVANNNGFSHHHGNSNNNGHGHHYLNGFDNDDDDDDDGMHDDDDEDDMVPPHEFIARKLARSQISSFSVCEGIGRRLKGRDLSKVRNAILTKTGFLE